MVVHDALGVARRTRRVEQRKRVPLVRRSRPRECGIALLQQVLVAHASQTLSRRAFAVVDVHDQRPVLQLREGGLHHGRVLGVGDEHRSTPVLEAERDGRRVQAHVERVEDRAQRRHGVVRFEERRDVGSHDRDGVAAPDAALRERRGEAPAARLHLAVRVREPPMADRDLVRPDERAALEESHGR
jgi:hypothetical protein